MDSQVSDQINRQAASGYLTIDLGAIRQNYQALSAMVAPARAGAVVKANAYGLGADRVAPVLYDAGCRDFFVAHFGEALAVRRFLAGDARIVVLNGLQPGCEADCARAGIVPVLNSLEQVANWSAAAKSADRSGDGRALPAILQFDTGMSRLGLAESETQQLVDHPDLLAGIDILFVMSHLASADDETSEQNARQRAIMAKVAGMFPETSVCFANSGGILLGREYHGDLARPGIALYGVDPSEVGTEPLVPVVRLDIRVIQVRTVGAGTLVGYSGRHVTSGERRLATLSAGYADGLPRHLSDRGAAYFDGKRLPIVGMVSMDSMTVDISALPEDALTLGSLVEVIGPNQTLSALARDAGTIPYEILTGLGQRYHRDYIY